MPARIFSRDQHRQLERVDELRVALSTSTGEGLLRLTQLVLSTSLASMKWQRERVGRWTP